MITKEDLLGTWKLESWTLGYSDSDKITNPFGEDPEGFLIYTEAGWMSASISRRGRARLPEDISFRSMPEATKAEAFSSYFHYTGPFRVEGGDVIHAVAQSLNPNFPGTEQLRHAELDGHTLVLSGKEEVGGITRFHSIVWHKVPPLSEVVNVASD